MVQLRAERPDDDDPPRRPRDASRYARSPSHGARGATGLQKQVLLRVHCDRRSPHRRQIETA
jgi:hypothetical protein